MGEANPVGLVEFLTARLQEDLTEIEKLGQPVSDPAMPFPSSHRAVIDYVLDDESWDQRRYFRLTADIKAKQALVREYEEAAVQYPADSRGYDESSGYGRIRTATLERIMRYLAVPYAAHSDYRQEWAP